MRSVALLTVLVIALFASCHGTALDDYVWRPDSNYAWHDTGLRLNGTGLAPGDAWTGYIINMTSQAWLTDADFAPSSESKSLWWHVLVIIVPSKVQWTRNATLYMTGGQNDGGLPKANDEDILIAATLAMANGIISGCLFQIPNGRITFAADVLQKARGEDAIIAFTWYHFLNNPQQPEWLVRFPMVKAGVRAMDTITAFGKQQFGYSLDYFMVAGASKRGWTTWDVAVVDSTGPQPGRVAAIVPIVLDAINFVKTIHHQFRSYGNWSFALKDYTALNLTIDFESPAMPMLQAEIDPYFYKERLTMPKLIVNAVLDEFQQPDDTLYWWDDMPEPKRFLICPNAEHSEATGVFEIVPAIIVWAEYLLKGAYAMPEFTWTIDPATGMITATLDKNGVVASADLWYAQSCGVNKADGKNRRDFRVIHMDQPCTCGITVKGFCANLKSLWQRTPLNATITPDGLRQYTGVMPAPADGTWAAFMILITYENAYGTANKGPILVPGRPDFISSFKAKLGGAAHGFPPIPVDYPGRLAFTTEVSVWPPTFPYAECHGSSCGTGLC